MLVQDTVCTSTTLIAKKRRVMPEDQITKTYIYLCLEVKLMANDRFVIKRDKRGVLDWDAVDVKYSSKLRDVLASKYPPVVAPTMGTL